MIAARPQLEMWGGVECTVNRVGDRWFDQLIWSGHDGRPDDLDQFASLGIRTLRYPVLWERLAPHRLDAIDWSWPDHRLGRLRDLDIRPIAGLLHHGSGPAYTSLLDDQFPEKLAAFAGAVARRYPWITDYTPVNEPLTTARFSGLYGLWYPHGRCDQMYVRALLNQARGTVLAMRAIREVVPTARLIQTEDCGRTFGTRELRAQVTHEAHRRWLTWDLLTGRVDRRHPLYRFLVDAGMTSADEAFFLEHTDGRPDVIGLNYYVTSDRYLDHRLDRYPPSTHGGNGFVRYADLEAVRARPDGIAGHAAHMHAAWSRYHIPVALTEVHLGCTRDEQMRWLVESWHAAERARAHGVDVQAVTTWALLGSFNWDSLVTRDAGHYEPGAFDVRGATPRPTALASIVRDFAAGAAPRHPALAGTPWWHRSERMATQGVRTVRASRGPAATILIIGATGTLGRAFQRICNLRGLPSFVASRHDVDIADATRVDAIVRRLQPWAVINAAGYVRVDAAEHEVDACRRANVIGPVNLAAACRRYGARLVTFSSDLVFDGRAGRSYVESDPPCPLNVYGETKAEAERCVLASLPDALVIRTSAFFSPWDEYHFLAAAFAAIDRGASFGAAADSVVSPTYVPDLVHAVLDLVNDGERGLWHLANQGAITWFEFARMAVEQSGRPAGKVTPILSADTWRPAVRPRFSALASDRGQLLRPLENALESYLAEARAARSATGTEGHPSQ